MTRDVLHIIQENMTSFSKGQRRIAGYILSDYDKAAFMTANKLGTVVGVSESTVVRFAAELGYDGYPAMQKALQEIVRSKLTSIQRIRASNDRLFGSDVVTTVLQTDMDKIRSAIESVDRSAFERVVDKLVGAKHIYILGVRSSSFLAGYLNFYFHLIFDNVTLVTSNSAGDILARTGRCTHRYQLSPVFPVHGEGGPLRPRPGGRRGGHHRQCPLAPVPHGLGITAGQQ